MMLMCTDMNANGLPCTIAEEDNCNTISSHALHFESKASSEYPSNFQGMIQTGQTCRPDGDFQEDLFGGLKAWNYDDFSFKQIGEGFFGTVYKVCHRSSGEILVLKELKSVSDEEHKTMFMEEIHTLGQLCHPNVLKCEGYAVHGPNLCLLTEYIEGGSLGDLLIKRDAMFSNWEYRLSVAMDVAIGMIYLHTAGIIHRDLTSGNILIRKRSSGKVQAIVADLGLSHKVPSEGISEEVYDLATVGSPFHMAPEVLNHKPYNMKADVFSYGIILCELITMCPGADPDDVPRTNDFGLAVDDLSTIATDCPSKVLDLTVRCCQVDPTERPPFSHIAIAIDIILDSLIESCDEEISIGDDGPVNARPNSKLDCVIEKSLLCRCGNGCSDDSEFAINEAMLGIRDVKDRFGSVQKTASRRLLKRHIPRCKTCGGRSWKSDAEFSTPGDCGRKLLFAERAENSRTPPMSIKDAMPGEQKDFNVVSLLNESPRTLETHLNELAENTPGKLPRFFQNILRWKFARIPRDVKRRWRKSLHDIFSSTAPHTPYAPAVSHNEDERHSAELVTSSSDNPTDNIREYGADVATDGTRSYLQLKWERRRKTSRIRKMSDDKKTDVSSEGVTAKRRDKEQRICIETKAAHFSNDVNVASSLLTKPLQQSLSKNLAVSIDSLDKLSLSSEGRKETARHRRRYSVPSKKTQHSHTQSNDPSIHPPLRKQSSSSSKILNFLRRKTHSTSGD